MSGPEDTGSNTVEDAARFERHRARRDDPPDDDGAEPSSSYRNGRREATHCTCHARSDEPCSYCTREADDP